MCENISHRLKQVLQLAESWEENHIPEIERDMVLGILQGIYEQLKFSKAEDICKKESEIEELLCQSAFQPEHPVENTLDICSANAQEVSEDLSPCCENKLFDMEDIPVKTNRNRKVILSLYGEETEDKYSVESDEPAKEELEICDVSDAGLICDKMEEIEIPDDIFENLDEAGVKIELDEIKSFVNPPSRDIANDEERKAVIGDVIKTHEKTIADSYAENNHTIDMASKISSAVVVGLRKAIGLNDKFLMVRDMFNGDTDAFDKTIDDLERFEDLNEALIHIHENYSWNPNSNGAKLLIDILTKKLS